MTKGNEIVFSIVIPVYGSELIIEELYRKLTAVMESIGKPFEVIFVDDCGPDESWRVLQSFASTDDRIIAIQLMSNSGQGAATLCGFSKVNGKFVITMDDDLQHPPEEIPHLWDALSSQEDIDVIMGVPRRKQHNFFRRIGSSFINQVNSIFLGKDPDLKFTSFRLMRRPVVSGLLELKTLHPALGPMINSVTRLVAMSVILTLTRSDGPRPALLTVPLTVVVDAGSGTSTRHHMAI